MRSSQWEMRLPPRVPNAVNGPLKTLKGGEQELLDLVDIKSGL